MFQIRRFKNIHWANLFLSIFAILFTLSCLEGAVRIIFGPVTYAGFTSAPNATLYGWGYPPDYSIVSTHPDTGQKLYSYTNSQGWRDVDHNFEKPQGVIRILVVGDSVTFGRGVPVDKLYSRVLEQLLKQSGYNAEVISMGYGGWGTDQELEALINEGVRYSPDIVISQFTSNDLWNNLAIDSPKPFLYQLQNGKLTRQTVDQRPTWQELDFYKPIFRWSALYHYLKPKVSQIIDTYLLDSNSDKRDKNWQNYSPPNLKLYSSDYSLLQKHYNLYFALLLKMKEVVEAQDGVLVLYVASQEEGQLAWDKQWNRIKTDSKGRHYIESKGEIHYIDFYALPKRLQDFADQYEIAFVPRKRKYERFVHDPHPNIVGNQAMAEDLFEFLVGNGYIDRGVYSR